MDSGVNDDSVDTKKRMTAQSCVCRVVLMFVVLPFRVTRTSPPFTP